MVHSVICGRQINKDGSCDRSHERRSPEVIKRDELCFLRPCAKLPSLPRTSEIHHVVIPVERSTSVYINLVRCVYHGFTFSLVLGVSPIAIVVCLINILICSSGVLR